MGDERRPDVRALVGIGVALVLLAAILHYGPAAVRIAFKRAPTAPNASELRDIQRLMELRLPPSARAVAWTYDSWMEYSVYLKVEIAPTELQGLIQNSPFATLPLSSIEHDFVRTIHNIGESWWDEGGNSQRFLFWTTRFPIGKQYPEKILKMLIDMDNEHVYVVYLEVDGT